MRGNIVTGSGYYSMFIFGVPLFCLPEISKCIIIKLLKTKTKIKKVGLQEKTVKSNGNLREVTSNLTPNERKRTLKE